MKAGIITHFYNSNNYGGLLQAYALCAAVNELGCEAQQIPYIPSRPSAYGSGVGYALYRVAADAYIALWSRFVDANNSERYEKCKAFRDSVPHCAPVTQENISGVNDKYDMFICGSDQVWNPYYYEDAYFLSFAPDDKRKISYAASISRDKLTQEEIDYMKPRLLRLDAISMREKQSVQLLESICGSDKKIEWAPDPVFLPTPQQWLGKAGEAEKAQGESYAFIYLLGHSSAHLKKAVNFAKSKGLTPRIIPDTTALGAPLDLIYNKYIIKGVGPLEFLSQINGAQYVLTDSFHAAAFSVIFKKKVCIFDRFAEGRPGSMNSRITSLLDTLHISRASVSAETADASPIDYDKAHAEIERMRETGLSFLKQQIEAAASFKK